MEIVNHECYLSLEVAKLLKKAGFNWECKMIHFCYVKDDYMWNLEDNDKKARSILKLDYCLLAPTLDVAQRWLREIKNSHIEIFPNSDMSAYIYNILLSGDKFWLGSPISYITYEEAQEASIKKTLEKILEKGE